MSIIGCAEGFFSGAKKHQSDICYAEQRRREAADNGFELSILQIWTFNFFIFELSILYIWTFNFTYLNFLFYIFELFDKGAGSQYGVCPHITIVLLLV